MVDRSSHPPFLVPQFHGLHDPKSSEIVGDSAQQLVPGSPSLISKVPQNRFLLYDVQNHTKLPKTHLDAKQAGPHLIPPQSLPSTATEHRSRQNHRGPLAPEIAFPTPPASSPLGAMRSVSAIRPEPRASPRVAPREASDLRRWPRIFRLERSIRVER